MTQLADRTKRIASSATMQVTATVETLRRAGIEQIKLAEATPVLVRTHADDGFAIRAATILAAITPRTRGVIVNSPCNPTGALISENDLAAIAAVTARQGIWLVVDLCYEKLIYDAVPHNLPAVLAKHCRDLAIICGSASKA